jgi:DNA polymerase-3 subunit epsilon
MRQIVLDTETTGLNPAQGHRIIEIGCVELKNRRYTGEKFHSYINPKRVIEAGAIEVHGITNEFLQDKPEFNQIIDQFLAFIDGAELIIHNAPFDVGFLNSELNLVAKKYGVVADYCGVLDTLLLARQKHPGQPNSLDALCKRYQVNHLDRSLHGALLDARLLAEVYLLMTGGQGALFGDSHLTSTPITKNVETITVKDFVALPVIHATQEEQQLHQQRLAAIKKQSGKCLWS